MVIGLAGTHGALALSLVVMADKSARASVTIQCPNMVENSARDPRENFTTAKRMTAQVR